MYVLYRYHPSFRRESDKGIFNPVIAPRSDKEIRSVLDGECVLSPQVMNRVTRQVLPSYTGRTLQACHIRYKKTEGLSVKHLNVLIQVSTVVSPRERRLLVDQVLGCSAPCSLKSLKESLISGLIAFPTLNSEVPWKEAVDEYLKELKRYASWCGKDELKLVARMERLFGEMPDKTGYSTEQLENVRAFFRTGIMHRHAEVYDGPKWLDEKTWTYRAGASEEEIIL